MVEEVLMCESFCSHEYRGCCMVFNFITEPGEEKEEDDVGVRDVVLVIDVEGNIGQVYIHMQ